LSKIFGVETGFGFGLGFGFGFADFGGVGDGFSQFSSVDEDSTTKLFIEVWAKE
jgi:hypothetical protein